MGVGGFQMTHGGVLFRSAICKAPASPEEIQEAQLRLGMALHLSHPANNVGGYYCIGHGKFRSSVR